MDTPAGLPSRHQAPAVRAGEDGLSALSRCILCIELELSPVPKPLVVAPESACQTSTSPAAGARTRPTLQLPEASCGAPELFAKEPLELQLRQGCLHVPTCCLTTATASATASRCSAPMATRRSPSLAPVRQTLPLFPFLSFLLLLLSNLPSSRFFSEQRAKELLELQLRHGYLHVPTCCLITAPASAKVSRYSAPMAARSSPLLAPAPPDLAAVGNGTAALGSDPDAHHRPPSAASPRPALPCGAAPRAQPKAGPLFLRQVQFQPVADLVWFRFRFSVGVCSCCKVINIYDKCCVPQVVNAFDFN